MVRRFLENYLTYTPTTMEKNWADALNMMTHNLRTVTLEPIARPGHRFQGSRRRDHIHVQAPLVGTCKGPALDVRRVRSQGSPSCP